MILQSFRLFLRQIVDDAMLVMVLVAPVLAACAFRFGIPALEMLLVEWIGKPVIAPWYPLVDLFLGILAPYMLLFASTMVLLEERDEGLAVYLAVTPLGRRGYLLSRLVLPGFLASLFTLVLVSFFSLVPLSLPERLALSLAATVLALVMSLLVYALAGNRIEGMALAKISSIILLGVVLPFVTRSPWRYLGGFLPSFWLGEARVAGGLLPAAAFALVSLLWLGLLLRHFSRRMARG